MDAQDISKNWVELAHGTKFDFADRKREPSEHNSDLVLFVRMSVYFKFESFKFVVGGGVCRTQGMPGLLSRCSECLIPFLDVMVFSTALVY